MKRFIDFTQRLWKDEEGATMVEYGIMVALIAGAAIATVVILGTNTDGAFLNINSEMATSGVPGTP